MLNDKISKISTPIYEINEMQSQNNLIWPSLVPTNPNILCGQTSNVASPTIINGSMSGEFINKNVNTGVLNIHPGSFNHSMMMNSVASPPDLYSGFHSPGAISDTFNIAGSSININRFDNDGTSSLQNYIYRMDHPPRENEIMDINNLTAFIPTIIDGLNANTEIEVLTSAKNLYILLKDPSSRPIVLEFKDVIFKLVDCISRNISTIPILKLCAGSIYYLSLNKDLAPVLFSSNILKLFSNLCDCKIEAILYFLISAVHTVFLCVPESRVFLKDVGHLDRFLNLFTHKNEKFLAILIDSFLLCIHVVNIDYLSRKNYLVENLLTILNTMKYEKLVLYACRFFKEISIYSTFKHQIIAFGGLQLLTHHLLHVSRQVAVLALVTIRNLSDAASSQQNQIELIDILIRFIRNQLSSISKESNPAKFEEHLVSSSLGILANITCNNSSNKEILISRDFVGTLINVCKIKGSKHILESALSTLRHITCRNDMYSEACSQFFNLNGLVVITDILSSHYSFPLRNSAYLKKTIFALLSNFASQPNYISNIRQMKITQSAALTLSAVMEEFKKNNQLENQSSVTNDISWKTHVYNCNKLLEICVILLHYMLSDSESLILMINSPYLMFLFASLLVTSEGQVLLYVINYFSEISNIDIGLVAVERAFISFQNDSSGHTNSTNNICVDRLTEIFSHTRAPSKIYAAISKLITNLSKSKLGSHLITLLNIANDGKVNEDDSKWECLMDAGFNHYIDSPVQVNLFPFHI